MLVRKNPLLFIYETVQEHFANAKLLSALPLQADSRIQKIVPECGAKPNHI